MGAIEPLQGEPASHSHGKIIPFRVNPLRREPVLLRRAGLTGHEGTMNTKTYFTMLAGLLLGGCNLSDETDSLPIDELEQPTSPLGDPASELESNEHASERSGQAIIPDECVGAPIVGILSNYPEAACDGFELPANFAWRPMFLNGSPDAAGVSLPVPEELQRYCVFEWVGAQPMEGRGAYAPLINAIDNYPYIDLDSVAADCMGFQEQSDLTDPNVTTALMDAFLANVDAVDAGDLGTTQGYREPVRLALLDSVSQWAVDNHVPAHNEHGRFMSSLIGTIACPDASDEKCPLQIHHMLAMPREDYMLPDWNVGKDYASKVDVAVQIYAAVQQWREAKINGDDDRADRLVINVSLGYNRINAGVDEFTRGPQASLKAALEFASCHGALVFAASGNVRDEVCPYNDTDPLAPAAFESLPAPSEADCIKMGFAPDWAQDFPVFGHERPLVYAVGALDGFGNPAVNARPHSLPQLVATGTNGVGRDMSMALTGSSVSTAVASATAMLVWGYNPRMTPDEVYAAMWESGYDMQRTADFGLNGNPGQMHRLSVCASLDFACSGANPNQCPQLGCVAAEPDKNANLDGYDYETKIILDDPATVIKEVDELPSTPVCDPTPQTELVLPQPELPICGNCKADIAKGAILNDDLLYMSIDASYKGLVTSAMLILSDDVGGVSTYMLSNTTITSLNDLGINVVKAKFNGPATVSATLTFTLATGMSQSNPVIVKRL
jgi:hypothetical protein